MSRTSLSVQLQHDAGKIWCIIIFTRSCKMLPIWTWPSSKGHTKVNIEIIRDFDVENICVKLQKDTGNSCRVIMFTRQLDLELVWKVKKVTQSSMSNSSEIFYKENIHIKLHHDTGNLWRVIAFTRFRTSPAQAMTIPVSLGLGWEVMINVVVGVIIQNNRCKQYG